SENSIGMRLSLTQADGNEQEDIIYISPDEKSKVHILQKEISTIITKHKNVGLAATFMALWNNLSKDKKNDE
ncbi:MAG: hypothetical protein ACFFDT_11125, partial [Candidatus Hodarchaeota archaeon]